MDGIDTSRTEKTKKHTSKGHQYRVILYNDDVHYFQDVVNQVCRAIQCSPEVAEAIVTDVERDGSGVVFAGNRKACQKVCYILEEIDLQVKIA